MQYFIGVTPPEAYQQRIIALQRRWLGDRLRHVAEPHLTVKAQGGLTADLAWLDPVRATCAAFPAFTVSLTEPTTFGGAILYLGTMSPEIVALHKQLVNAVAPTPDLIEQYFELDRYIPHVTLGQTQWGLTAAELAAMQAEAVGILSPFPTFTVACVRIYRTGALNRYEPFEDMRLA